MNNKIYSIAIGGAAALLSQFAFAHTGGKANAGYVGDSSGHIVMDSSGECLRTSAWTKDMAIAECERGMLPKKAAVATEPKSEPVAVAPAPAAMPAVKPEPTFEEITLKAGALFDSGKAELKPAGKAELAQLVTKLKTLQDVESVQVTGHTDSQGPDAYNKQLSEQRAAAVKAYLAQNGIDEKVISTAGVGDSKPKASNDTAEGRALNRRVQLEIKTQRLVTP
jgi:OOP family OmpA-OmpF porin